MPRLTRIASIGGLTALSALIASGCLSGPALGLGSGEAAGFPPYGPISVEEAAAVIAALLGEPEFVLLDIRTPEEVEAGHLPGAVNLDFRNPDFANELDKLDRDRIYLIYCRTANRTGQAFDLMTTMGFTKVYDMQGGIREWNEKGYPVCEGPLGEEHPCVGEYPAPTSG